MGKLIARQLLKGGFTVVTAERRVEQMQDLAVQEAIPIQLDVSNEEGLSAAVEHTSTTRSAVSMYKSTMQGLVFMVREGRKDSSHWCVGHLEIEQILIKLVVIFITQQVVKISAMLHPVKNSILIAILENGTQATINFPHGKA